MSKSLMSIEKECYVCGALYNLHKHHVYGGTGRRQVSEREGCWVWLCGPHHNMSNHGVHFDQELNARIRKECEIKWLTKNEASIEDFIKTFGASYL